MNVATVYRQRCRPWAPGLLLLMMLWPLPAAAADGVLSREQRPEWAGAAAEARASSAPEPAQPGEPRDAFVTLNAWDFVGSGSDGPSIAASNPWSRSCEHVACTYLAGAPLPHGSTLVGVEVEGCHDDPGDGVYMAAGLVRLSANGGTEEVLAEVEVGSGCDYFYTGLASPHTVDQYLGTYLVVVAIVSFCNITQGECPSDEERFQAVRVYYRSGGGEVVPTGTEPSLFP